MQYSIMRVIVSQDFPHQEISCGSHIGTNALYQRLLKEDYTLSGPVWLHVRVGLGAGTCHHGDDRGSLQLCRGAL